MKLREAKSARGLTHRICRGSVELAVVVALNGASLEEGRRTGLVASRRRRAATASMGGGASLVAAVKVTGWPFKVADGGWKRGPAAASLAGGRRRRVWR